MPDGNTDEAAPLAVPTVRVLDALEASTRATTAVSGHLKGLERRVEGLERENGTMNAHLDNMVRQQEITNSLLEDSNEIRNRELESAATKDKEERDWRRTLIERGLDKEDNREDRGNQLEDDREDRGNQLEDDNRAMAKRAGAEAWAIFKQPLGYLIAGVIGWVLYTSFGVPAGSAAPTVQEDGATHAPATRTEP